MHVVYSGGRRGGLTEAQGGWQSSVGKAASSGCAPCEGRRREGDTIKK
jgi:hypothetical protein